MRVLIAGGTGFIGRSLVNALLERGDEVFVVSRNPASQSNGAKVVDYDHLPDHADAVINLAGEWIAGVWTPAKKLAIMNSRIETTRRLVDWMLDCAGRMPVLLNASAVGFYGDRPGEILTEESPYDPRNRFRGRVCLAWEQEALRATEFGARVVLLRMGGVLDEAGGMLSVTMPLIRRVPFLIPPCPHEVLPWVSMEDTVRMILFALDRPEITGPFNITAPTPVTYAELTSKLGAALGKRTVGSVPKWMVRALLWENSEAIADSQDVRPAKALEHGYEFTHPRLSDWIREEFAPHHTHSVVPA